MATETLTISSRLFCQECKRFTEHRKEPPDV